MEHVFGTHCAELVITNARITVKGLREQLKMGKRLALRLEREPFIMPVV